VAIEPALLPAQLEQLPDLEGFLKIASLPEWRRVQLHGASPVRTAVPARTAQVHAPTHASLHAAEGFEHD
jgi:hypothetical protein